MENEEKLNEMEEETGAAEKELLTDEELADVSGGSRNVWNSKKSRHKCPFCGHPSFFEDMEWEQMAPTLPIRCSKCRSSYPKLRWDPMPTRL